MSIKALVTVFLVALMFVAAQGIAWFIALSSGIEFGTRDYGLIAGFCAAFWLCSLPAAIIYRHAP